MKLTQEKEVIKFNGFLVLILILGLYLVSAYLFIMAIMKNQPPIVAIPIIVFTSLLLGGFYIVQPNEARVLTFFGKYIGSARDGGFWWSNPFTVKKAISLRIRNFDSTKIKVNDSHGSPIEIAAVIVWKVEDSASALFDVEDYQEYVQIQSETALRHLASQYPYDSEEEKSLRASSDEVVLTLRNELKLKLKDAGVAIIEAKLSHLAYSPEIAQAMLRRQQAQAIISARQKIVEGAVGMVEMALRKLSEQNIIELDDERKATMVNNLLVTLVSENETRQVINTGSIY
jgi:regulator of protease activity HflC (stomatin/prohibitin superfamily)